MSDLIFKRCAGCRLQRLASKIAVFEAEFESMKKEWENAPNDDLKEVYLRRLVSKGNKIAGLQETEVRLLRQKEKDSSRLHRLQEKKWKRQEEERKHQEKLLETGKIGY